MPRHTKRHIQLFIWFPIVTVIVGGAFVLWNLYGNNPYPDEPTEFGATFSTKYTKELGLDSQEVFWATLDELQIKKYRIPVYWDEIEEVEGELDLSEIQWMMDQAAAYDAKVTLAIGVRVPRWPECHPPEWVKNRTQEQQQEAEKKMMETVVNTFKDHPALERWQVENEPLFAVFGECASPDKLFLKELIDMVREKDPKHKVMITDSGELSTWTETAALGDILGVSMYRVTWNALWGYFYYPLPPRHYTVKANFVAELVDEVIISELQVEPWPPGTIITETPIEEQYRSMDKDRFLRNIDYARRTQISEVYLWGVEWWYWLKEKQENDSMWEVGKKVFRNQFE